MYEKKEKNYKKECEKNNLVKDLSNSVNNQVINTKNEENDNHNSNDKTCLDKSKNIFSKQSKSIDKKRSKTKILAGTGVFAALAFLISFLEIPIFPAAPYLKLDFSSMFILLSGFVFGPLSAVASCLIKELLRYIAGSATGGIGEIANVIVTLSFVLLPTIVYKYKKGIKIVILTLLISCLFQTAAGLIANRFLLFPLYMGKNAQTIFTQTWVYIALFNIIKSFAVSILTIIVYKKVSGFIKKI